MNPVVKDLLIVLGVGVPFAITILKILFKKVFCLNRNSVGYKHFYSGYKYPNIQRIS